MCISVTSWSSPKSPGKPVVLADRLAVSDGRPLRDSVRVAERKLARKGARMERQRERIMKKWDQRTMQQKRTDRRAIIFLVISAGILANTIAHKE
jgi:hypothetical protein